MKDIRYNCHVKGKTRVERHGEPAVPYYAFALDLIYFDEGKNMYRSFRLGEESGVLEEEGATGLSSDHLLAYCAIDEALDRIKMMGLNNEPMVIYSDSYRVARQVGVQPEGKKRQEIPVQRNIDYREKALVVRNKLEAYFPKTRVIGISVEDNAMAERLI